MRPARAAAAVFSSWVIVFASRTAAGRGVSRGAAVPTARLTSGTSHNGSYVNLRAGNGGQGRFRALTGRRRRVIPTGGVGAAVAAAAAARWSSRYWSTVSSRRSRALVGSRSAGAASGCSGTGCKRPSATIARSGGRTRSRLPAGSVRRQLTPSSRRCAPGSVAAAGLSAAKRPAALMAGDAGRIISTSLRSVSTRLVIS